MMCGLLVQLKQLCKTTTYVGFVDALFPFLYIFNTLNYGILYLLKNKSASCFMHQNNVHMYHKACSI